MMNREERLAARAQRERRLAKIIRVDRDHPIPDGALLSPSNFLKTLEVGESFFEDCSDSGKSRIYDAARKLKQRSGGEFSFIARKENGGVRIWRTA